MADLHEEAFNTVLSIDQESEQELFLSNSYDVLAQKIVAIDGILQNLIDVDKRRSSNDDDEQSNQIPNLSIEPVDDEQSFHSSSQEDEQSFESSQDILNEEDVSNDALEQNNNIQKDGVIVQEQSNNVQERGAVLQSSFKPLKTLTLQIEEKQRAHEQRVSQLVCDFAARSPRSPFYQTFRRPDEIQQRLQKTEEKSIKQEVNLNKLVDDFRQVSRQTLHILQGILDDLRQNDEVALARAQAQNSFNIQLAQQVRQLDISMKELTENVQNLKTND